MADAQQIEVYNPQGQLGTIPSAQLEKAKTAGYRPKSDFVEAVHPKTGQTGIIPKAQWSAAQKQGYAMSPREQQRAKAKAGTAIQPDPMSKTLENPYIKELERRNIEGAKFGTEALAFGEISRALRAFGTPTRKTVQVATKILDPQGNPMTKEVELMGESQAKRLLNYLLKKGAKKALTSIGGVAAYEGAKHMGVPLP